MLRQKQNNQHMVVNGAYGLSGQKMVKSTKADSDPELYNSDTANYLLHNELSALEV